MAYFDNSTMGSLFNRPSTNSGDYKVNYNSGDPENMYQTLPASDPTMYPEAGAPTINPQNNTGSPPGATAADGATSDPMGSILDLIYQPNAYSRSGSYGTSKSSSNSSGFSGLDSATRNSLLNSLRPNMRDITDTSGIIGQTNQAAQKAYEMQARRSLEQVLPQVLEAMGNRNMLSSSATGNAVQGATENIVRDLAQKSYESQMNAPTMLAQLLDLAKYSQSSSKSSGTSNSASFSENPGEAVNRLSNFILNY